MTEDADDAAYVARSGVKLRPGVMAPPWSANMPSCYLCPVCRAMRADCSSQVKYPMAAGRL